jgi:hypothetical protein
MVGPIWLRWLFAGVMLFSAVFHAGRLVAAGQQRKGHGPNHGPSHRPTHSYDDLAQLVMSTAMAAMLMISFSAHLAVAWGVVIGVILLWSTVRVARVLISDGWARASGGGRAIDQPIQQVPMFAAMVFMLAVAGGGSASAASRVVRTEEQYPTW